jgi:hypothetical protein
MAEFNGSGTAYPDDDEPTDYDLHSALASAIRRGAVTVEVDFPRINRNNVRGFRTTDFIVPPFILIILSLYLSVQIGVLYGIVVFALGAAFILLVIRPRAHAATIERVRGYALDHLEAWNEVWKNGGYHLRLADRPDVECRAPDCDWRVFVRRHFEVPR